MEGRLEFIRTLLFKSASQALVDLDAPMEPADVKHLAAALLNVEKAGHLNDQRIAAAEARAKAQAGARSEKAVRRVQQRVEGLQDRVSRFPEAVPPHPLDFADPDRHARQLGRVGVDLDPVDVGRADLWKRSLEVQRLGLELDAVLEVLECLQG